MIVVFGANGQLGQELLVLSEELGVSLRGLSRGEVDISNHSQVRDAISGLRPTVVVNAAAYTKVDLAESEIDAALACNATGAAVLASACAAANVAMIHISTDYVFDGSKATAYVETDPTRPINAYGRSKEKGEAAVRNALARHVILRTSWLYGAFGSNFLKTMLRLANERDEIRVVADQRGCATSTRAVAQAVLGIASQIATKPAWGTFHFAARGVMTWYDFAAEIVRLQSSVTGRRPLIVPITTAEFPTPARRPANSVLNCDRYDQVFGLPRPWWADDARGVVQNLLSGSRSVGGTKPRATSN